MKFTKMHGLGNDYIYINCFREWVKAPRDLAIKLSNRHFGIGADGLILIKAGKLCKFEMEMYNADGSRAETCGNGLRCVAKYLYDNKLTDKKEFEIETGGNVCKVRVELLGEGGVDGGGGEVWNGEVGNGKVGNVEINMGKAEFRAEKIPVLGYSGGVISEDIKVLDRVFKFTGVSMGNPHCVIFLEGGESLEGFALERYGRELEHHKIFPNRINVEIVEVISREEVRQRTWERGSGETLACGTGACAVLGAGIENKILDKRVRNHLKGGMVLLEADEAGDIYLKGPAELVFEGEIYI